MKSSPYTIALLVLVSHGIWSFLLSIWNDFFAFGPIYFYLAGIYAVLPALRLDFHRGFFCAALSGCFLDAALPAPFGFHVCGLVLAQVALHSTNERTSIRSRPTLVAAALIINFTLFLGLHIWFSFKLPEGAEILHGKAFVDLLFSQILLAIILPWLISLHDAFLGIIGYKERLDPRASV
jgi:hypothetical protein